jgi:hypothetical protein
MDQDHEQKEEVRYFVRFQRVYRNILSLAEVRLLKMLWVARYPQKALDGSFKYEWSPQMGEIFVNGSPFEEEHSLPGSFTFSAQQHTKALAISEDLTSVVRAGDWIRVNGVEIQVKYVRWTEHEKCVKLEREFAGEAGTFLDAVKLKVRDVTPVTTRNGRSIDRHQLTKLSQGVLDEWDSTACFTALCGCSHELLPRPMSDREYQSVLAAGTVLLAKDEQAYRLGRKRAIRNVDDGHKSRTTMNRVRFTEVMEEARQHIRAFVCDDSAFRDSLLAEVQRIENEEVDEQQELLRLQKDRAIETLRWWRRLWVSRVQQRRLLQRVNRMEHELDRALESLRQPSPTPCTDVDRTLLDILQPLTDEFRGRILCHVQAFCPGTREWIFKRFRAWAGMETGSTDVFVLTADKGVGKSCMAAVLTQLEADFVYGHFFCAHDTERWRNPRRLIMTWAHQLSERIPEYKTALLNVIAKEKQEPIAEMDVTDLFKMLLSAPLHAAAKQLHSAPPKPIALLIDALDECEHHGRNDLLRVIRTHWLEMPSWVKLIVTTRPSSGSGQIHDILKQLQLFKPLVVRTDDTSNKRDVVHYSCQLLRSKIADEEMAKAVAVLAGKAEGTFLYLHYAKKMLLLSLQATDSRVSQFTTMPYLTLVELEALPEGLIELYKDEFCRIDAALAEGGGLETKGWTPTQVANWLRQIYSGKYAQYANEVVANEIDGEVMCDLSKGDLKDLGIDSGIARSQIHKAWTRAAASVLQQCMEAVVAALEPIPVGKIAGILGCELQQANQVLGGLALFFRERNGCIEVGHKSVCDWLTDPKREGEKYWVVQRQGHQLLANACMKVVQVLVKTEAVTRRREALIRTASHIHGEETSIAMDDLRRGAATNCWMGGGPIASVFSRLQQPKECANILCQETNSKRNKRCSRCKVARYCSDSCQRIDWEGEYSHMYDSVCSHKMQCSFLRKFRNERLRIKRQKRNLQQHQNTVANQMSQWEQYCLRYVVRHLREGDSQGACTRVSSYAICAILRASRKRAWHSGFPVSTMTAVKVGTRTCTASTASRWSMLKRYIYDHI